MSRKVKLELTLPQAEALFGFAVEGQVDAEARQDNEPDHPSTLAAGDRAVRKLGSAVAAARGMVLP